VARIARALNEAGIPCPSAADPERNPHRTGAGWTLGTVTTILSNPRYTGHQVWNRQRDARAKVTLREFHGCRLCEDLVDIAVWSCSHGLTKDTLSG
jgi:hypothetical protein